MEEIKQLLRTKNIKEILEFIGAEGLANEEGNCGCSINDLMPCGSDCSECKPAFRYIPKDPNFSYQYFSFPKCGHNQYIKVEEDVEDPKDSWPELYCKVHCELCNGKE